MFGNELTDTDVEYNAILFDKILFNDDSIRVAGRAAHLMNPDLINPTIAVSDAIHMASGDASQLVPSYYPMSMHRRWLDGKLIWTVNITFCRSDEQGMLCTTKNTTAGRSIERDFAVLAAMIRLIPIIEAANTFGPVAA